MLLLLARHGNTFEACDKIVWVGARTDLPLTAKGRDQAAALGRALVPMVPRLKRVISGPLKRTNEHAAIVCGTLTAMLSEDKSGEKRSSAHFRQDTDERLREIDYGLWEGKTLEEIASLGGGAELRAWDSRGEWPSSPGWSPPANTILSNIAVLTTELAEGLAPRDVALLITSNGILKFFLKLVPGAFDDMAGRGALKVGTGHCCALRHGEKGWGVEFWNKAPGELALGPGPAVRSET